MKKTQKDNTELHHNNEKQKSKESLGRVNEDENRYNSNELGDVNKIGRPLKKKKLIDSLESSNNRELSFSRETSNNSRSTNNRELSINSRSTNNRESSNNSRSTNNRESSNNSRSTNNRESSNNFTPSIGSIYTPLNQKNPTRIQIKRQEREKNQEVTKFRKKLMRINDESNKIRKKKASLVEKEKQLKHKRGKILSKIKLKGLKMGHFRDLVESVLIENNEIKENAVEIDVREQKAIENLAELIKWDDM